MFKNVIRNINNYAYRCTTKQKVSHMLHVEVNTGLKGQKQANTLLRRACFCCFGYQTNGFALHLPAIGRRQDASDIQEVCDPRLCVVLRIICFVWLFFHSLILSLPSNCTLPFDKLCQDLPPAVFAFKFRFSSVF